MAICWKAVEQVFTVVLFIFQFYPGFNFGKFISFGLGTVRSERVTARVNPFTPGIKLQFLLLCFHAFLTEVVGRSC